MNLDSLDQWLICIRDSQLSASTKLVLYNLSLYFKKKCPSPSITVQMSDCNISKPTVINAIKTAEKEGFIAIKKEKGHCNQYDFVVK